MTAAAPKFHPGIVTGNQTRDESGVSAVEFNDLLSTLAFEQQALAAAIDMDMGQLSNLLCGKQKWISLKLADRILMALGCAERLSELVVIPGHLFSDARQMAYYECLDENDKPTATLEEIMERAHELWAMREMMLSGDPEAIAFVKESFTT